MEIFSEVLFGCLLVIFIIVGVAVTLFLPEENVEVKKVQALTDEELKEQAREMYDAVRNGGVCVSSALYDAVFAELEKRGLELD